MAGENNSVKNVVNLRNNLNTEKSETGLDWMAASGGKFLLARLSPEQSEAIGKLSKEEFEVAFPPYTHIQYDKGNGKLVVAVADIVGENPAAPSNEAIVKFQDVLKDLAPAIQQALKGEKPEEPDTTSISSAYTSLDKRLNKASGDLQWEVSGNNLVANITPEQAAGLAEYMKLRPYDSDLLPSGSTIENGTITIPNDTKMPQMERGKPANAADPEVAKGVEARNELVNHYLQNLPILEQAMKGDALGALKAHAARDLELNGRPYRGEPIFITDASAQDTYAVVKSTGDNAYTVQFVVNGDAQHPVPTFNNYHDPKAILALMQKTPDEIAKIAENQVQENAKIQTRDQGVSLNEQPAPEKTAVAVQAPAKEAGNPDFDALLAKYGIVKQGTYDYQHQGGHTAGDLGITKGGPQPSPAQGGAALC